MQLAERARGRAAEWHGRFDEVALHEIDANIAQPVEVLLMLDLLRNDSELHRSCQFDHRCNHFLVDFIRIQIARVGSVDLQIINWQMFEACK